MFTLRIGSFEVSSQRGDFRLKLGSREVYWSRDTGFVFEDCR